MTAVVTISDRGTLTIPSKMRKKFKSQHVTCSFSGENIILSPLQTREEFLAELDEIEADWKKNGGSSWEDVMKKSHELP